MFLLRSCNQWSWGYTVAFRKEKKLRSAFRKIRDEFEMHLDSINTNTEEIFENRAMVLELQDRMDKLADKVHESSSFEEEYPQIELTLREQEVFLVLYTAAEAVSYPQLSRQLSLPVALVQELTFSMIQKGVPVIKRRNDSGGVLVSLDIEFAELQSRKNIVGIDQNLSAQLSRELQMSLLE